MVAKVLLVLLLAASAGGCLDSACAGESVVTWQTSSVPDAPAIAVGTGASTLGQYGDQQLVGVYYGSEEGSVWLQVAGRPYNPWPQEHEVGRLVVRAGDPRVMLDQFLTDLTHWSPQERATWIESALAQDQMPRFPQGEIALPDGSPLTTEFPYSWYANVTSSDASLGWLTTHPHWELRVQRDWFTLTNGTAQLVVGGGDAMDARSLRNRADEVAQMVGLPPPGSALRIERTGSPC